MERNYSVQPETIQNFTNPEAIKLNSLTHDKISDLSKFKAFADNNLNVARMTKLVFDRVENIVGKDENAGYQHFPFFPTMFSKALFLQGCSKSGLWSKANVTLTFDLAVTHELNLSPQGKYK